MQQVPIERFQVPQVKNDPMSFRNRPLVKGIRPYQIEEPIGLGASFGQASKQAMLGSSSILGGKHLNHPPRLAKGRL